MKKRILAWLLVAVMCIGMLPISAMAADDTPKDYGTRNGTTLTGNDTDGYAGNVNLYTMYTDAYMNFVVYAYDYPDTADAANLITKEVRFQFVKGTFADDDGGVEEAAGTVNGEYVLPDASAVTAGSQYHIIPAEWLTDDSKEVLGDSSTSYQELTRYDEKVFYHKMHQKGDRNGNVAVFIEGPLKGLVLFCDTGYVFIGGMVASGAVANTTDALGTAKIAIKATGVAGDDNFKPIDGTAKFTFQFSTEYNNDFAAAPAIVDTWLDTGFAVSHGFATIKSEADEYYALGFGTTATQAVGGETNLSSWYPGTGKTLIIPFFGTATGRSNKGEDASDAGQRSCVYYLRTLPITTDVSSTQTSDTYTPNAGSGYVCDFKQAGTNFSFPTACAMLSDGGVLVLNLTKGATYSDVEALAGTFAHLRCTADGGAGNCVGSSGTGWASLSVSDKVEVTTRPSQSGGSPVTVINTLANGSVQTTEVTTYTPKNTGCSYWPSGSNAAFSSFIQINITGGLSHTPSGAGGETDVESDAAYYIQIWDTASNEWKTLPIDNGDDEDSIGNDGADITVTGYDIALGLNASLDGTNCYYTTTEDSAQATIEGLEPGTAYRIVFIANKNATDTTGVTNSLAYFTAPESVDAAVTFDHSASANAKLNVVVTQEYGAYETGKEFCQEYKLQVADGDGAFVDVTGSNKGWWNTASSANSAVTITDGSTITFVGLDEEKTYRVVSRMAEDEATGTIVGEILTKTDEKIEASAPTALKPSGNLSAPNTVITIDGERSSDYEVQYVIRDSDGKITDTYILGESDTSAENGVTYEVQMREKTDDNSGTWLDTGKTITIKDDTGSVALDYVTLTFDQTPAEDENGEDNVKSITVTGSCGAAVIDVTPSGGDKTYLVYKNTAPTITVEYESGYTLDKWEGIDYADKDESDPTALADNELPGGEDFNVGDTGLILTVYAKKRSSSSKPSGNVSASTNPGGTISNPGTTKLPEGESKEYEITPDDDHKILDVIVNGESKGPVDSITVVGGKDSTVVEAIFTDKDNNVLSTQPVDNGSISVVTKPEDQSSSGNLSAYKPGTSVTVTITPEEGYFLRDVVINGKSYGANESLTIVISEDMELVPLFAAIVELNDEDHFGYIVGYTDGTFRPNQNISREEVASIFFRLLTEESRNMYLTKTNNFTDVSSSRWSNTAISTLCAAGIISGRTETSFAPSAPITRAEFAAIASRFIAVTYTGANKFTDVTNHWAMTDINNAANNGWIQGSGDGTFQPNKNITRAEAVTLLNNVLNRKPEVASDLHEDMVVWSDNMNPAAWYYYAVQEASNSHDYARKADGIHESWTGMRETPDWKALEK